MRDTLKYDEESGTAKQGAETYKSDDFMNAYNLVSHEDKLDTEELLLRTFVAVFLLKLFHFNKFFTEESQEEFLTDQEVFIGEIIIHLINSLPQNVHDVA